MLSFKIDSFTDRINTDCWVEATTKRGTKFTFNLMVFACSVPIIGKPDLLFPFENPSRRAESLSSWVDHLTGRSIPSKQLPLELSPPIPLTASPSPIEWVFYCTTPSIPHTLKSQAFQSHSLVAAATFNLPVSVLRRGRKGVQESRADSSWISENV